jgi:hypothetical protein
VRLAGRSIVAARIAVACALLPGAFACGRSEPSSEGRTFATPEDAVRALIQASKSGTQGELVAIFGPESQELIASSDPDTARKQREVFSVATAERWLLVDRDGTSKTLVIGNEEWPFPIPLVKDGASWRFDAAAGKEEVLARQIGRNELAVMQICHAYVAAQRIYAQRAHDGKRPGLYAARFRSDPGRQNGLYWPAGRGAKRSPLGDLIAHAGSGGGPIEKGAASPAPFHGYYFRILTAQGASAPGGAKDYVRGGDLADGFALVAWPAQYDVTGVMTFVINHDAALYEKNLGPDTGRAVEAMTAYDPDSSWNKAQ